MILFGQVRHEIKSRVGEDLPLIVEEEPEQSESVTQHVFSAISKTLGLKDASNLLTAKKLMLQVWHMALTSRPDLTQLDRT